MLLTVGGAEWAAAQVATPPPARREPQRSLENEHPPLFFREDWKLDPNVPNVNNEREPEHPIVQGDVANPNLEVRLYGDRTGTRMVDQTFNNHLIVRHDTAVRVELRDYAQAQNPERRFERAGVGAPATDPAAVRASTGSRSTASPFRERRRARQPRASN